jgi:hypothetical protein
MQHSCGAIIIWVEFPKVLLHKIVTVEPLEKNANQILTNFTLNKLLMKFVGVLPIVLF